MTTTTPSPARNRSSRQGRPTLPRSPGAGGFTLVELMIGASLASFILAGVLSTFLFMGRSGANVNNYNDMEAQAREALEYFAEDTRQASGVVWSDANTVALTVGSLRVTYQYIPTNRRFTRQEVVIATGVVNSTRVLVTGITSFCRYPWRPRAPTPRLSRPPTPCSPPVSFCATSASPPEPSVLLPIP